MTTFASTDFNGTSDAVLETFDSNFNRGTGIQSESAHISDAGRLRNTLVGANYHPYYHSTAPASADYSVQATLRCIATAGSAAIGVTFRHSTSADTYYWFGHETGAGPVESGTQWLLEKWVAGTHTYLGYGVATLTPGNDYTVKLDGVGSTITPTVNGSSVLGGTYGGTDSSITAAGRPGLMVWGVVTDITGEHFDDWQADETASASAEPVLISHYRRRVA